MPNPTYGSFIARPILTPLIPDWFFGGLSLNDLGGVSRFTSYSITSVNVGGQALGRVHPVKVERYKRSTLQLLPDAITSRDAFKMTFKHT